MGGEQQHHGMIGDFLDEGIRTVGDGNAFLGRGCHIDVIDADRPQRHDAAFVERLDHAPAELHALGINGIGAASNGEKPLFRGGAFEDFGIEVLERLQFEAIAAAAVAEGGAGGRQNAELGHGVFPGVFAAGMDA